MAMKVTQVQVKAGVRRVRPQAVTGARRGFTLVEVLAGLALVAIVLPVAVRAIAVGTAAADMARHRLEAASLAQSKLDELVVTRDWVQADASGDFDEPFERYTWTAAMDEFDSDVQMLTVQVSWQRRGQRQGVQLATLVDISEQTEMSAE